MSDAMNMLLVDHQPAQAVLLAEFLLRRGVRVETVGDTRQALRAVERRAMSGAGYDLVLVVHEPPAIDGLAFLSALRGQGSAAVAALTTPFAGIDPGIRQRAENFGCRRVFDRPIDLADLQRFLDDQARLLRPSGAISTPADAPFFGSGSGRLSASHMTPLSNRALADPAAGGAPVAPVHRGSTSGYTRTRSGTNYDPRRLESTPTTTSRYRRSVTGRISGGETAPAAKAATGAQRRVACAHCNGAFVVAIKPEPYNVVCIHCGGLNRIEP